MARFKFKESKSINQVNTPKESPVPKSRTYEEKQTQDIFPFIQHIIDIFKDFHSFSGEGMADGLDKILIEQLNVCKVGILDFLEKNPELALQRNKDGRTPAQVLLDFYTQSGYLQNSGAGPEAQRKEILYDTLVAVDRKKPTIVFDEIEGEESLKWQLKKDLAITPSTCQAFVDHEKYGNTFLAPFFAPPVLPQFMLREDIREREKLTADNKTNEARPGLRQRED
jgi:hypothetical protein